MQNSDNTIYFNFSYFALKLLGKGLYSNHWTAIAELVANGLDAKAQNVKIYINMIDKNNSTIEILDNGYGMGYEDLADKYVLIGKNKREDEEIDEETKKELMGRKGIGKLAALYLSNKYYLISKTATEESSWCLDASSVSDSDIPKLDRIDSGLVKIESINPWETFQTGTLIKLTNVDLNNFGVRTIMALKARLADFYLLDSLKGKIEVAIKTVDEDEVVFEEVQKSIAFKNMYAFYNNTDIDFSNKLSDHIIIKSQIKEIMEKPREVIWLDSGKFNVSGKKKFSRPDGTKTDDELEYRMDGWIGIHTSIQKEDAMLNDKEYLKNKAYRPNQLRLYVRKKLAVENFLEYVKNTQAFSNYIEGEISFDILDDNQLGDIATSNRQGFVEDDERVQLLIEILQPIINTLIKTRVKLGSSVKKEEKAYNDEILRIEKCKLEEEERRRYEAEKKREEEEKKRIAETIKRQEEERRRKQAELKREEEERRRKVAELRKEEETRKRRIAELVKEEEVKKRIASENELQVVSSDLGREKKRIIF